jgi:vacuolar-type H+-ATPase subunit E/Vma4
MKSLSERALELCWKIEKFPSSEHQTETSLAAVNLRKEILELEKYILSTNKHLDKLQNWASQEPTGPWNKVEIQQWVLDEIKASRIIP